MPGQEVASSLLTFRWPGFSHMASLNERRLESVV